MNRERTFAIAATLLCVVPLLIWLYQFWTPAFSDKSDDWADFGTYIGGVLTPILAFASFVGLLATIAQQRAAQAVQKAIFDDERFFDHAVKDLARAYDTLYDNQNPSRPRQDRLAWLTAARLILAARNARAGISEYSHGLKALLDSEEEHWRRQLYLLFQGPPGSMPYLDARYFHNVESRDSSPIDERSIRVIYEFVTWPEGRVDPISKVPRYTREEAESMRVTMSGVREYVLSQTRFR